MLNDGVSRYRARMRFNKQEMVTLATQPSNKFDKEGILLIRERTDGFFRKSEGIYDRILLLINTTGYTRP